MNQIRHTFPSEERLKGVREISGLFTEGNSFLAYPVKVVWMLTDPEQKVPVKAGFAVSKKNFRNAVQRNILKRRMKEAYRLQKHQLILEVEEKKMICMFVYIGKEELPYPVIEKSFMTALSRIGKSLKQSK
jgi:ribonuclease P protein component